MSLVDWGTQVKLWCVMSRWHVPLVENDCPDSKPMRDDEIECGKSKSNERISIRSEKDVLGIVDAPPAVNLISPLGKHCLCIYIRNEVDIQILDRGVEGAARVSPSSRLSLSRSFVNRCQLLLELTLSPQH